FVAWRTAQTTAILRRGVEAVALNHGMTRLKGGGARVPLVAPSLLRSYALRSAIVFVLLIVAIGAGTLMLREAAVARVAINARRGTGNVPTMAVWIDTPSGVAIAQSGAVYWADSSHDVVWRYEPGTNTKLTQFAGGDERNGFSGDGGLATRAR